MPTINWKRTIKQTEAWNLLTDQKTTELLFGGGAGGAKSFLGCAWLILMCLNYPRTRWVMGRKVLKRLKETTLATFFEVCKAWGIQQEVHFNYSAFDGAIKWRNGSQILLKDLMTYPTDPEFESLGSLEITGAFVDEASEVSQKAVNILNSRRRYLLDENNLIPKTLLTCNPTKRWIYSEFYKPYKENRLPSYKAFVPALATDNPFISKHYIENLKKLDPVSKERLLFGNWEFDSDPTKLLEYDEIMDLFTNEGEPGDTYISCDVARFGADRTVIMLWRGLQVAGIWTMEKSSVKDVTNKLEELSVAYSVRRSRIVVDEDGIGGGVVDTMEGIKGVVNNARPFSGNYANLKTQCAYEFVRLAKEGKIGIKNVSPEDREMIVQELEQLKRKNPDSDGKIALIGKDQIKENIGRSPDLSDCLIYRCYFEAKPNKKFSMLTF